MPLIDDLAFEVTNQYTSEKNVYYEEVYFPKWDLTIRWYKSASCMGRKIDRISYGASHYNKQGNFFDVWEYESILRNRKNSKYTNYDEGVYEYLLGKKVYLLKQSSGEEVMVDTDFLEIALFLGCSRDQVKGSISRLINKGYVEKVSGKRTRTNYEKHGIVHNYYNPIIEDNDIINRFFAEEFGISRRNPIGTGTIGRFLRIKAEMLADFRLVINRDDEQLTAINSEKRKNAISKRERREHRIMVDLEEYKQISQPYIDLLKQVNGYGFNHRYIDEGSRRLTNTLCNGKSEKHLDSTRLQDIQTAFKTNREIIGFDVNAAIYRLHYALGNKRCFNHTDDIYEVVFKHCNFDTTISFSDIRKDFKLLFMPITMREWGTNYAIKMYEIKKKWSYFRCGKDADMVAFYNRLTNALNCGIRYLLETVKATLKKLFNLEKLYSRHIFMYESNLYILMLWELQQRGIKVINVYDCFYVIKGTLSKKGFNELYDKCIYTLLKDEILMAA